MLNECLSSECPHPRLQNLSAHSSCCLRWGPGTQDSGASLASPPWRNLQLGRHRGQRDSSVCNVRPWRVGVPSRGAETRGGTRRKWTWSSTHGEGVEAEVRVCTQVSETRPLGGAGGGEDEPRNGPREGQGQAFAGLLHGRKDEVGGSEGGDSVHLAGAGWGLRARPEPGWREGAESGSTQWPAERWEHRAGWRAQPFLALVGPSTSPTPGSEPLRSWQGQRHLDDGPTHPHLRRFAKGQEWGGVSIPFLRNPEPKPAFPLAPWPLDLRPLLSSVPLTPPCPTRPGLPPLAASMASPGPWALSGLHLWTALREMPSLYG